VSEAAREHRHMPRYLQLVLASLEEVAYVVLLFVEGYAGVLLLVGRVHVGYAALVDLEHRLAQEDAIAECREEVALERDAEQLLEPELGGDLDQQERVDLLLARLVACHGGAMAHGGVALRSKRGSRHRCHKEARAQERENGGTRYEEREAAQAFSDAHSLDIAVRRGADSGWHAREGVRARESGRDNGCAIWSGVGRDHKHRGNAKMTAVLLSLRLRLRLGLSGVH